MMAPKMMISPMEAIVSPNPFFRTGTMSANGITRRAMASDTRNRDKKRMQFKPGGEDDNDYYSGEDEA